MAMRLHFPEFPDHPNNGGSCEDLDEDTKVGDYIHVATIGSCVVVAVDGEDVTLMLTGGATPDEES